MCQEKLMNKDDNLREKRMVFLTSSRLRKKCCEILFSAFIRCKFCNVLTFSYKLVQLASYAVTNYFFLHVLKLKAHSCYVLQFFKSLFYKKLFIFFK